MRKSRPGKHSVNVNVLTGRGILYQGKTKAARGVSRTADSDIILNWIGPFNQGNC